MSDRKLRLATSNGLEPRVVAARAKLAEVIADRDGLKQQIEAAKSATEKAWEHVYSAQARLDELLAADHVEPETAGDRLAAALISGAVIDLATIDRPDVRQQREAGLKRELGLWRQARMSAETNLLALEDRLAWADRHIRLCAHDVFEASNIGATLLARAAQAHAELQEALGALSAVNIVDTIEVIRMRNVKPDERAATVWREALAELQADASAALPEV
jgi:hypothetical protein